MFKEEVRIPNHLAQEIPQQSHVRLALTTTQIQLATLAALVLAVALVARDIRLACLATSVPHSTLPEASEFGPNDRSTPPVAGVADGAGVACATSTMAIAPAFATPPVAGVGGQDVKLAM